MKKYLLVLIGVLYAILRKKKQPETQDVRMMKNPGIPDTCQVKSEKNKEKWDPDTDRDHLKFYTDKKIYTEFKSNPKNLWVRHDKNSFNQDFRYGRRQRDRYEKFCIGFLYFYDAHINTKGIDHNIYFDWGKNGTSVSVYINPAPVQRQYQIVTQPPDIEETDPPRPPAPPPPEMGMEA